MRQPKEEETELQWFFVKPFLGGKKKRERMKRTRIAFHSIRNDKCTFSSSESPFRYFVSRDEPICQPTIPFPATKLSHGGYQQWQCNFEMKIVFTIHYHGAYAWSHPRLICSYLSCQHQVLKQQATRQIPLFLLLNKPRKVKQMTPKIVRTESWPSERVKVIKLLHD